MHSPSSPASRKASKRSAGYSPLLSISRARGRTLSRARRRTTSRSCRISEESSKSTAAGYRRAAGSVGAMAPLVAVTFGPVTDLLHEALDDVADLASASRRVPDAERTAALGAAEALLVWNAARELRPGEGPTLPARFVQLVSAGADHLPFGELPA